MAGKWVVVVTPGGGKVRVWMPTLHLPKKAA